MKHLLIILITLIFISISISDLNAVDMNSENLKSKLQLGENYEPIYFEKWKVTGDSLTFSYMNSNSVLTSRTVAINDINKFSVYNGDYTFEGFIFVFIPSAIIGGFAIAQYGGFEGFLYGAVFSLFPATVGAMIGAGVDKWHEIKFSKTNGKETSLLITPSYIPQANTIGLGLTVNF